MMLAPVLARTIGDRWVGVAVAAGSLSLLLLGGMAVYSGIDLSLYADLPRSIRDLMGIGEVTDAGRLAYGAIYSVVGALAFAGVAISMGSSAIAGEERDGTMGLLMSNPRSRGYVLWWKAAGIVLLSACGALVLWAAALVAPAVVGVDIASIEVGALVLHMFVNAIFYGLLALSIGAWTGNATAASAGAAGVMVISYLTVGILPLVGGLDDLARAFPWYYYDGGDPLTNGVDWSHLAVLLGACGAALWVGLIGLRRRDLRGRGVRVTVIDWLRENPHTQLVMDRVAGSARVSRIAVKAASERQGMLLVAGAILLLIGVMIGPLYGLIDDDLKKLSKGLPEGVLALIGNADMSTPEGWYNAESFSLVVPIALIAVAIGAGASALAGEERRRTMGLLLANPVSRTRVVCEKAVAMVVHVAIVGIMAFMGTALGSILGGLGISLASIAAASLLATLLGLVFGAAALALGAASGRMAITVSGPVGLAFVLYLLNSFLPLNDGLGDYAKVSPFHYYLSSDPLANGMQWGHATVLAALAGALVALAVVLFGRRDLRRGD